MVKICSIILSEECFFHAAIFFPEYWQTLKQVVEECFDEEVTIDCLLYLRIQDLWALSKFKEGVRNRIVWTLDFDETVQDYQRIGLLDYNDIVLKLEEAFGKEHVYIRDYNRKRLYKESIVPDFFKVTALSFPYDNIPPTSDANRSLTTEMAQAMLYINRNAKPTDIRRNLYKASTRLSYFNPNGYNEHFWTNEQRKEFLKQYEEGNTELGKRYGDGGNFFQGWKEMKQYNNNPLKVKLTVSKIKASLIYLDIKKMYNNFKRAIKKNKE